MKIEKEKEMIDEMINSYGAEIKKL